MPKKNVSFEEALSALEGIVAKLESGDCGLEESIDLYERGMKNVMECRSALQRAQQKIKSLDQAEEEI